MKELLPPPAVAVAVPWTAKRTPRFPRCFAVLVAAWIALLLVRCQGGGASRPLPGSPEAAASHSALSSASVATSAAPAPPEDPLFEPDDPAFRADPEDFPLKKAPQPGDWLARFKEHNINFVEYQRSRPTTRTSSRSVIVLQPLGEFTAAEQEVLGKLQEYMTVFFDTPTRLAKPLPLPARGLRERKDEGKTWIQYHTPTLLNEVLRPKLPADALCYLGVTMADLYPEESWNYVFGEATLEKRVGVYSLVRYFPAFWGDKDTPAARRKALLRSFKVLSHETGHMFSLRHCTRFECTMNGTNSLDETDRAPAHLCPECLKKLQWNLRFVVRQRYQRLRDLYRREGMPEQAAWIDKRLARIGPTPESH